jgi:hypothetical protein
MTSPTIVEHEGTLFMSYLGWATFPDGPVTLAGATSNDDGRSWQKVGALSWDDIFGVEAHTEKGPDGMFYRVGVGGDAAGDDVLLLGRAQHPFGPYEVRPEPILTEGGPAVGEGDSVMSPSLLFDDTTGTAYMHYAAVDTGGWPWVVSLARTSYQREGAPDSALSLDSLSTWTREPGGPIFGGTVIAADPYVWRDDDGRYRMLYTDDLDERLAIAMATSDDLVHWQPIEDAEHENGIVLGGLPMFE